MLWLLLQSTSVCYRMITILSSSTTYYSIFNRPMEAVFDLIISAHSTAGNLVPFLL